GERFRLHLWNACAERQRGQFPHGLDAGLLQLGDLDTSDVGDQAQMVNLFPFVGTALVPSTIAAVTAGLADGPAWRVLGQALKPLLLQPPLGKKIRWRAS